MAGYGEVAVVAARKVSEKGVSPLNAWEEAARELLLTQDMRTKGCPKAAFLGLCANGDIEIDQGGPYDGALESPNAQYAIAAVKYLRLMGGASGIDEKSLWPKALKLAKGKAGTAHNQQMSVVLALAKANLIKGVKGSPSEAEI